MLCLSAHQDINCTAEINNSKMYVHVEYTSLFVPRHNSWVSVLLWCAHAFERWWIKLRMDLLVITVPLLDILVWSDDKDIRCIDNTISTPRYATFVMLWPWLSKNFSFSPACSHVPAIAGTYSFKLWIRNWTSRWWILWSQVQKGVGKGDSRLVQQKIFHAVNPDYFQPSFYAAVYD